MFIPCIWPLSACLSSNSMYTILACTCATVYLAIYSNLGRQITKPTTKFTEIEFFIFQYQWKSVKSLTKKNLCFGNVWVEFVVPKVLGTDKEISTSSFQHASDRHVDIARSDGSDLDETQTFAMSCNLTAHLCLRNFSQWQAHGFGNFVIHRKFRFGLGWLKCSFQSKI